MKASKGKDGKIRITMSRQEWETIGLGFGNNTQPIGFKKQDMGLLISLLMSKGLPGRIAIDMLRSPVQRQAIEAIFDIMSRNYSYWRNVIRDMA